MSSRREEKEQRRAERVAAEEAAARSDARRRRLGIVLGVVLGLAAAGAIAVAVFSGSAEDPGPVMPTATVASVPIPPQRATELGPAARGAGCSLRTFKDGPRDRGHTESRVRYKQNPPVFGPHYPVQASDGSYVGRPAPSLEHLVHALEHGRVLIWYRPAIAEQRIGQLQTLFREPFAGRPAGYKQTLVAHPDMPFAVAATTWGQQIGCPEINESTFDALRAFRTTYVDQAPEPDIPWPQ